VARRSPVGRNGPRTGHGPVSATTRPSSTPGQDGGGSSPSRIAHSCRQRRRFRIVTPVGRVSVGDTQISIRGRCGFLVFSCSVAFEPFPRTK
jgi:hypothetical protein